MSDIVISMLDVYSFFMSNSVFRLVPVLFIFPIAVYAVFSLLRR